jgi:hypothetical protein
VRSALVQQPAPIEVVVVDDASDDGTGVVAEALGARVVTHAQNQGEGAARNSGLQAVREPWVALLDADDEWLPGHLEALWDARERHVLVGAAALGCGERPEDHRVRGWAGRRPARLNGPADVALPENKLTASSVLLRRDVALAAGGFRRDLPRAADLDLWVRMLSRGTGIALPRVTALYHQHEAQVSADRAQMDSAQRAVLDAYANQRWCTRSVLRRNEGRIAWDAARAALASGAPPGRTALSLAWTLRSPARALGVAQTLATRRFARRLSTRYAAGGAPSVALLKGATEPPALSGAVDLRRRSLLAALLELARHPTAQALVPGRAVGVLVRALGVRPVIEPRARARRAG